MRQTAVEWFGKKVLDVITTDEFKKLLEQAKQMEKKQIIEAYKQGQHDSDPRETDAEDYYNKTFKSE
jgi:hypothetical protein